MRPSAGVGRLFRARAGGAVFAAVLAVLPACHMTRAPLHPLGPAGQWYTVASGDSAESIAKRAGVPVEDLLEINGLSRASEVRPGKLLFVLESDEKREARGAPSGGENNDSRTPAASPGAPGARAPFRPQGTASGDAPLRWPVSYPHLTSPFGSRWGRPHEGIDMAVPIGTPVLAAQAGTVVYAGDGIRGYGNLVVLQHAGDLLTVYAHNSVLEVHEGDRVTAGQQVALSGQSGRVTAPHLHFEVRQGQVPKDPLLFLPPPPTTRGQTR